MLYSKIDAQINWVIDNIFHGNMCRPVVKDVIINLATITLATFNNGPYKMNQNVKIINLTDESKKHYNGVIGKIVDIYIDIDNQHNVIYQYVVCNDKNNERYMVKEKNLEAVKEEKHYVIEGYYSDILGFYKTSFHQFYIKKDDESFIATQSVEKATIFTKDEISEISLDFMPQIENITWRFNELQKS